MSEDPWADVFAMAEGESFSAVENPEPSLSADEHSPKNTQPSSKKKKAKIHQNHKNHARSWSDHLWRRSRADLSVFDWDEIELRNGLCEHTCRGWNSSSSDNTVCQECGEPSFRHVLAATSVLPSTQSSWVWDAYSSFRNLRCASISNLLKPSEKSLKRTRKLAKRTLKLLDHVWKMQQSQLVGTILDNAWSTLLKLLHKIAKSDSKNMVQTEFVELIMACDDCYLKLYYLDLTTLQTKLAHPVAYFRETLETMKDNVVKHSLLDGLSKDVCDRYNVASSFSLHKADALTALHQIRFLETIALFHKNKPENIQSTAWINAVNTMSTSLDRHDTPAPPLLRRWRDSCRDFVTHLYGYATLPPPHLQAIADFAQGTTILELGAGTGYLAHLLQQRNVDVVPLDVAPTTPMAKKRKRQRSNDYHASTPAFTTVEEGTSVTMKKMMTDKTNKRYTLLMAYAPPDSEMGYETVLAFCQAGGRRLIHIGEFCGLTGTHRMEQYLARHGSRVEGKVMELPCPTWGTDSASTSFWNLDQSETRVNDISTPLILCHHCRSRPATKRFCVLRYLCFCRESCWKEFKKSNEIGQHLVCSSLTGLVDTKAIDFDSPRHFLDLSG